MFRLGPRKGESTATWGFRRLLTFWPCYLGTGGRVTFVSSDWRSVVVELPLSARTRNYVGTIFGGSMYGAVDPIYMLQLMKILGPEYVVWDKAASIRFKRPGRTLLTARFEIPEAEIEAIHAATRSGESIDRVYQVALKDPEGQVCAIVEKTLYIRKKAVTSPRDEGVPGSPRRT